jgi:DNA-binding MarR family transcriptional regulator
MEETCVEARLTDGPLSTLELDAWRGLLRTHAALSRELDRQMSDAEGLGLSSYEVLLRLAQSPNRRARMKDIADSLLLSRSGLTGIIGELERRGYVTREPVAQDRRGVEAVLTRTGQAAFKRAHRVHLNGVRNLFVRCLSDQQLRHLTGAWNALGISTGPDLNGSDSQ